MAMLSHKARVEDYVQEQILSGRWRPGDRIDSVRDLAQALAVNANTVLRGYARLKEAGVIAGQRGKGFVVAPSGWTKAHRIVQEELEDELPVLFRQMCLLGMTCEDLKVLFSDYKIRYNIESFKD